MLTFTDEQKRQIFGRCNRYLRGHYPLRPKAVLKQLSNLVDDDVTSDFYGEGKVIQDFEIQIAKILGKESAVFMPSGTMAQVIAMRIWSDRKKCKYIGLHPTSHLELHEHKAYQHLHGLERVLVGHKEQQISVEDVEVILHPLSALLIELPQREIGGTLPEWKTLVSISEKVRSRGVALHMDGARLWECQPYYQKSYQEIASLFDSVYVSFYKGLGGIAGAVLAGEKSFIDEARIWQRRQGGNLVSLYPYIISARDGLERHLPKMPEYHAKAVEIGNALSVYPELKITPNPPPTNMMHIYIPGPMEKLESESLAIARENQILISRKFSESDRPGYSCFEFMVGDATLDLKIAEIVEIFGRFVNAVR